MTSYQKRKQEIRELEEKALRGYEFERMLKNYIRSDMKGQTQSKEDIKEWFRKNSPFYAREIGLFDFRG